MEYGNTLPPKLKKKVASRQAPMLSLSKWLTLASVKSKSFMNQN